MDPIHLIERAERTLNGGQEFDFPVLTDEANDITVTMERSGKTANSYC